MSYGRLWIEHFSESLAEVEASKFEIELDMRRWIMD
jgi:hypothetical protein